MTNSNTREDRGTSGSTYSSQTQQGVTPDPTVTGTAWSQTSTSRSYGYTAKQSAGSMIDQYMQQLFGRRATAKEKAAFYKNLHSLEKKYVTKSKTSASGAGGSSTQRSTSTNINFNAQDYAYEYSVNLASEYINSGKEFGGKARDTFNAMKTYSDDMGVVFNSSSGIKDTIAVITGKKDENVLKESIRKRAISLYGSLAERLTANPSMTVRDAATDYISVMNQMIETPMTISLQDNTLSKALTATKDGKPYTKTLNEFRNDLRADARFQYSAFAHQEAANLGKSLAQAFRGA